MDWQRIPVEGRIISKAKLSKKMLMESHFKYVESFELDILALVPKHVHHHLQIAFLGNVSSHDVEVGTVKEDFAEKLERLSLGDIIGGK